jgi:hypothetical protein
VVLAAGGAPRAQLAVASAAVDSAASREASVTPIAIAIATAKRTSETALTASIRIQRPARFPDGTTRYGTASQ